jgi:3-deoxy-D-manno-octulosonate 8-phosphate phosphatase (KDO 8-P phosphatase)
LSELELYEKLKKVKLLVMDVDGTLTDAGMYFTENGEAFKRFSTRDGMGVVLLKKSGIDSAIITSENSKIVEARAKKLSIEYVILGSHNKEFALKELCSRLKLDLENIAYIGDDVNDAYAMRISGICACPNDSVEYIKNLSNYVCKENGGYGAVREFAELILKAQNKPNYLTENW